MNSLLIHLRNKKLITNNTQDLLMNLSSDALQQIVTRKLQNPTTKKYSPSLRAFALTLQFYSSKAYNYVRKTFQNVLPHPATLRKWYTVVDAKPGFTKEAFDVLQLHSKNNNVICNLVVDEMAIMQKVEWDGKQFHGFVDIGTNYCNEDDYLPEARNVLVLMLVALNSNWKIPVGYFLISSLDAQQRSNLIQHCLKLCHESNVKIYSLTFDGAAVNIAMCTELGACFKYGQTFKPYIYHPTTKEKIYVMWDACHMLKLIRNTFCDKNTIQDPAGNLIKWDFLSKLQNYQEREGLHAANKLSNRHINFKNEKMNVKLAAQTLSSSVASALLYCEKQIKLPEFQGAESTAYFCEIINNAFDLLNSRNKFSKKEFNQCMSQTTCEAYIQYINGCIKYIAQLKTSDNMLLINSTRKTGFLGIIICLTNLIDIYKTLIQKTSMTYLLSYKLSQDHLEVFFSAVRSYGGNSNNPTALQFLRIYKRMLVRHEVWGSQFGNCIDYQSVTILHVTSAHVREPVDYLIDTSTLEIDHDDITLDHAYHDSFGLNPYINDVVGYMSGFVVRKVRKGLDCEICLNDIVSKDSSSLLINIKDRGGLTKASKDVHRLCLLCERVCRQTEACIFVKNNIKLYLACQTKFLVDSNIFSSFAMQQHMLNQTVLNNHRNQLIDVIIQTYINIRLHYFAKLASERENRIRKFYNHLTLFKNE
ncbi:hypothetical protein PPYR_09498 [Photinus pyralis]|nr:hypothetical protein PPYR_09498 [Photinus pyralis]